MGLVGDSNDYELCLHQRPGFFGDGLQRGMVIQYRSQRDSNRVQSFELVCPGSQFFLHLLAFGDVLTTRYDGHGLSIGVHDDIGHQLDREPTSIFPDVDTLPLPGIHGLYLVQGHRLPELIGGKDSDILADQIIRRIPVHVCLSGIRIQDFPGDAGDGHTELHGLHGFFQPTQRFLCLLALGNVTEGDHYADNLAVFPVGHGGVLNRETCPIPFAKNSIGHMTHDPVFQRRIDGTVILHVGAPVRVVQNGMYRPANQLVGLISGRSRHSRVYKRDIALQIQSINSLARCV